MTEAFDPYYRWLAIPREEQPPNHYRLLGLKLFEQDGDVIETAADRQMAHLRTYQSGQHSAESQRLLNEIALARICLLNPAKRKAYDETLATEIQLAAPKPNVAPPLALPVAAPDALSELEELTGTTYKPRKKRLSHRHKKPARWPIVAPVVVCVVGLIAIGVLFYFKIWPMPPLNPPPGQSEPKTIQSPSKEGHNTP